MLIALIITVITVFLYETVTSILVMAAGSSGLLLVINQLSYYNPYEETPNKTYLLFLFLKVFAVGAVVQTVIFVASSAKTIKRKKEIEANEREIKKREEKYYEELDRAKETKDGAFDYLDKHTTPDEKRDLARQMLGMAYGQEKAQEERAKALKAQLEAQRAEEYQQRKDNEQYREQQELLNEMKENYQFDEWRQEDMYWDNK